MKKATIFHSEREKHRKQPNTVGIFCSVVPSVVEKTVDNTIFLPFTTETTEYFKHFAKRWYHSEINYIPKVLIMFGCGLFGCTVAKEDRNDDASLTIHDEEAPSLEKTNKLITITDEIADRIYNGEPGLMHDLWNAVERYVSWIANKYSKEYAANGLASSAEEAYDDIYNGCGYPAMCDAVKQFDPKRGDFISLFTFFIRKEMRSFYGVRSMKRDPALDAKSLNVKVGEDGDLEQLDFIVDTNDYYEEVENRILQTEARRLIDAALGEINDKQAYVVRGLYLDGIPTTELSESLSCARSYVYALKKQAFASIKKGKYKDKLFEILHPGAESMYGFRGTSLQAYRDTGERATERAALELIQLKEKYGIK